VAVAFSTDGKLQATATRSGVRVAHCDTGNELRRWEFAITGCCVAFSPDSKWLALGCFDDGDQIKLVEAATGKEVRMLEAAKAAKAEEQEPHHFGSIAFSPDSKVVAALDTTDGTNPPVMRLWDVANGRALRSWRAVAEPVAGAPSLCFSPDGKLLACAGEVNVRLWDVATGKEVQRCLSKAAIASVAFSPDGKFLAGGELVAEGQARIYLWDPATGSKIRSWRSHEGVVSALAFSPDSRRLASASNRDQAVYLWRAATGKMLHGWYTEDNECVTFTPDGNKLATVGASKVVRFWDLAAREDQRADGHGGSIAQLRFAADGRHLLAVSGKYRLWDLESGKAVFVSNGDYGLAAILPDGQLLEMNRLKNKRFQFVEVLSGRERASWQYLEPGTLESYELASSGKWVLIMARANGEPVPQVREVATSRAIRPLNKAYPLGFSADGQVLIGRIPFTKLNGEAATKLCLWDLERQREIACWEHPRDYFAMSANGQLLAATTPEAGAEIWNVTSHKRLARLAISNAGLPRGEFSADGKLLAVAPFGLGLRPTVVDVFETATGDKVAEIKNGHQGEITAITLSPDGSLLATGSADTTILVWDLARSAKTGPPAAGEMATLWADLAGDGAQAYPAMARLTAGTSATLDFLRPRLAAVAVADPERLKELTADLGGKEFAARTKAENALLALTEAALPALRRALDGKPGLEAQRRIEQLIAQIENPRGDRLRLLRAVTLLERIGTPAARDILQKLSGGIEEARLTQDARAALARLAQLAGR